MSYYSSQMKYIKPVQDIVDQLYEIDSDIEVVPTFQSEPKTKLSCITHKCGTDKFGLICINVDGIDSDLNCFIFNGKLYDYCRAEGFTRQQMVDDWENKVLTRVDKEELVKYITG